MSSTRVAACLAFVALLLIGAARVHAAASAVFVGADTSTRGNWKGIYGADGAYVVRDTSSNNPSDPSYASTTNATGTSIVWASPTTDVRALKTTLPASTTRIASAIYSATNFNIDVNTVDGKPHQLALYMVDWDNKHRSQSVTIKDAVSSAVLDTETASSFSNGVYLVWKLSGHVTVTFTNLAGPSAVLSGWFYDYPGLILSKISITPATASVAANGTWQYSATGLDQDGNPLSTQPTIHWSSTAGTVDNTGLFTAPAITGPVTVSATAGGVTGTATANVASTHTVTFSSLQSTSFSGILSGGQPVDIDGDGHVDLVALKSNGLVFLYGAGNGTFTRVDYPYAVSGRGPMAYGDLKHNGKVDVVVTTSNSVTVINNLGSRTFSPPVSYPAASDANGVAVGDFNNDGYPDIASVGTNSADLSVLLNNGDGTFGAPATQEIPGNGYTVCVATADVNSDGDLDIICSKEYEFGTPTGAVFLGDGHGNFVRPSNWYVNVGGGSLGVADLNNDGLPDLYNSDHWAGQPRWAIGDGKGGFPGQYTQGGAGYAGGIFAADFDGDGFLDLMESYSAPTNELLYINNGDGTFPEAARDTLPGAGSGVADFNEDGAPDDYGLGGGTLSMYLNTTSPAPTIDVLQPNGAKVGGTKTLIVHGHGFLKRSVIKWNGTSLTTTFNYHTGTLSTSLTPTQLASAGTASVTVFTSAPGGGTSNAMPFFVGKVPTSITITPSPAAVNVGATVQLTATVRDQAGTPMPVQPLVAWSATGSANTVTPAGVFSTGPYAGNYSATASYAGLTATAVVSITDFSLSSSPSSVIAARGTSTKTTVSITPYNGFSSAVRLSASGLPGGVVASFYPGATSSSTRLTFTVSPTATTGTFPVTVTGVVDGSPRTTIVSLTVAPSAAVSFPVSIPSVVQANVPFNATVSALDKFGNVASGYNGTVHYTSTDGAAVLPADATLAGGTGTVSVTLKTDGTQTVTAADVAHPTIQGTSGGAVVLVAVAIKVVAPSSVTVNVPFNFTVTAVDKYNHVAPGYAGTLQFSTNAPRAMLPSPSTLSNGTGTFSATMTKVGTAAANFKITAGDTVTSTMRGTSAAIAVGP